MKVKCVDLCCVGGRGVVRLRLVPGSQDRDCPAGHRRGNSTMHGNEWWRGCLRVMLPLAPLLAIAMPVHAQVSGPGGQVLGCPNSSCVATDPAGLADVAEPGSVLVFPKWALGTVTLDNGAIEPRVQL